MLGSKQTWPTPSPSNWEFFKSEIEFEKLIARSRQPIESGKTQLNLIAIAL